MRTIGQVIFVTKVINDRVLTRLERSLTIRVIIFVGSLKDLRAINEDITDLCQAVREEKVGMIRNEIELTRLMPFISVYIVRVRRYSLSKTFSTSFLFTSRFVPTPTKKRGIRYLLQPFTLSVPTNKKKEASEQGSAVKVMSRSR